MLVFDLCKRSTFDNCARWIEDMKSNGCEKARLMLIGNKLDLVLLDPSARAVRADEAERLAASHDGIYDEVSAVTNKNVEASFLKLLNLIYKERRYEQQISKLSKTGDISIDSMPIDKRFHGKDDKEKDWCC